MSIIHDALRKVQDNFRRKPTIDDAPRGDEREKPKTNWLNVFFSLLILLTCLYFGYTQLLKHWDRIRMAFDLPNVKLQKIELPKVTITTSQDKDQKPRPVEHKPGVPMATIQDANGEGKLNVQGIMIQGDSTVVLINDKIYEEGDAVGDIVIKSIDNLGITILRNGQEELIRVRH